MNTYAINLVRRINKTIKDNNETSFFNYSQSVQRLRAKNNHISQQIQKNLSFANISQILILSLGFFSSLALIGFVIYQESNIGIVLETSLFYFIMKIILGSSLISAAAMLFYSSNILKKHSNEIQKTMEPYNQIIEEISHLENFQKILPILQQHIDTDSLKEILIAVSEGELKNNHIKQIEIAIKKYFIDNFNPDNFISIQQALDESQKQELKNQKIKEPTQENIQFFTKNS